MTDAIPGYADLMTLARLLVDPAALQASLDGYAARDAKSRDAQLAAERAVKALAAKESEIEKRTAALEKREAEIDALEKRWMARKAQQDAREERLSADGQRKWLLEQIEHAKGNDERTRRRVVRLAELRPNLNEAMQSLPSWDQIEAELLMAPDPHFGLLDTEPDPSALLPLPAHVTMTRDSARNQ
jgi:hypothetical protein